MTQVIQPGRFSSPETNLMFHIRDRAADGRLIGLVMHDTRDKTQSQSYLAEHGEIVKQDKTAYLVMSAGHIIRRTDANEPPQIVAFDKYVVDLDRFEPQDTGSSELKPRERYWSELTDPEPDSRLYKTQPGQFRSELHERLVNPLYPIAFAFLIVAFVGQARSTRSNRLQRTSRCIPDWSDLQACGARVDECRGSQSGACRPALRHAARRHRFVVDLDQGRGPSEIGPGGDRQSRRCRALRP